MPGYAYVERDGCGLRILEAGEGNPPHPGQPPLPLLLRR
jgi:hypothetical protein